jgi:Flp pilus assembly protein TadG
MSLHKAVLRFAEDTRGNIAVITVFLLVPILVIAGGATDIARQESYRAQLQDSVDRAVLAAAPLDQTLTIADTVREYLKSLPFASAVTVTSSNKTATNSKTVTVTASYVMRTYFLHFVGMRTLTVAASATAEEKRTNVEISLMLDISGSMRFVSSSGKRRIDELKPAAQEFINTILTTESAAYTSVNIVPYAGHVNISANIFNGLGASRSHNNSSCVELLDADYASGLPNLSGRTQVPHFTHSNFNTAVSDMIWWWCPEENSSISIFSDSKTTLNQRITGYKMADGTGTAVAMNWGLLLLNPVLRPYVQQAAQIGMVPNKFKDRPANWDDLGTKKFIVLMTDGAISDQYRPKDNARATNIAPDNKTVQTRTQARDLMYKVCNFAKSKNVTIFTIGFEVDATAQTEMKSCASSASHFYPVAGIDIKTAFRSIATAIQKIKLTN